MFLLFCHLPGSATPWYLGRGESHFWGGCRTAFSLLTLGGGSGTGKRDRLDGRHPPGPRGRRAGRGPGGCGARRAASPGPGPRPSAAPAAGTIARAGGRAGGGRALPGRRPRPAPRSRTRTLAPTRRPPRHCAGAAAAAAAPAMDVRLPLGARGVGARPGAEPAGLAPGLLPLRQGRRGRGGGRRARPARAFRTRRAGSVPGWSARAAVTRRLGTRALSGTRAGDAGGVDARAHAPQPCRRAHTPLAPIPLAVTLQRPGCWDHRQEVTRQLLTRSHSDTLTTSPLARPRARIHEPMRVTQCRPATHLLTLPSPGHPPSNTHNHTVTRLHCHPAAPEVTVLTLTHTRRVPCPHAATRGHNSGQAHKEVAPTVTRQLPE